MENIRFAYFGAHKQVKPNKFVPHVITIAYVRHDTGVSYGYAMCNLDKDRFVKHEGRKVSTERLMKTAVEVATKDLFKLSGADRYITDSVVDMMKSHDLKHVAVSEALSQHFFISNPEFVL